MQNDIGPRLCIECACIAGRQRTWQMWNSCQEVSCVPVKNAWRRLTLSFWLRSQNVKTCTHWVGGHYQYFGMDGLVYTFVCVRGEVPFFRSLVRSLVRLFVRSCVVWFCPSIGRFDANGCPTQNKHRANTNDTFECVAIKHLEGAK